MAVALQPIYLVSLFTTIRIFFSSLWMWTLLRDFFSFRQHFSMLKWYKCMVWEESYMY